MRRPIVWLWGPYASEVATQLATALRISGEVTYTAPTEASFARATEAQGVKPLIVVADLTEDGLDAAHAVGATTPDSTFIVRLWAPPRAPKGGIEGPGGRVATMGQPAGTMRRDALGRSTSPLKSEQYATIRGYKPRLICHQDDDATTIATLLSAVGGESWL